MESSGPKLYRDLASWFHLLAAPAEYAEDADYYLAALRDACDGTVRTLLELGSGGGNVASHLRRSLELTLVDISPEMLTVSRSINADVEHVLGDMRSIRLEQLYDAVLIQDAISYITNEADLERTLATAFAHLRPGGAAIFAPDHIRETFETTTDCGGHDGRGRALRYVEWLWDPDPADTTYAQDFVLLLREEGSDLRVEHDRHVMGLFGRDTWLAILGRVGFEARAVRFDHSEIPPGSHELFIATRPPSPSDQ